MVADLRLDMKEVYDVSNGKSRFDKQRAEDIVEGYIQKLEKMSVGSHLLFGEYMLGDYDGNKYSDIKKHISWRVLKKEGSRFLLLSDEILEYCPYVPGAMFHLFELHLHPNRFQKGTNSWKESFARQFLEEEGLKEWFSEEEQALISSVKLSPSRNPETGSEQEPTIDRLFLPGMEDVADLDDLRTPMCYVEQDSDEDPIYIEELYQYWWLRTPGEEEDKITYCDENGNIWEGTGISDEIGLRPCFYLDIESLYKLKEKMMIKTIERTFHKEDNVKIIDGPFSGNTGTISEIYAQNGEIAVKLASNHMVVHLGYKEIEKVDDLSE